MFCEGTPFSFSYFKITLDILNIESELIIRKTLNEIRNVTVDEFPWHGHSL